MTTLETAQQWADMGFAPIPIQFQDKKPEVAWKQYQDALPTECEITQWFGQGEHNLALVTGHGGFTVLDCDSAAAYDTWRQWALDHGGQAATVARLSYRVTTSRGMHIYLMLPQATRSRPLRKAGSAAGIDIKSRGGYVLAPPSVHPDGTHYTATCGPIWSVTALSDVLPPDLLLDTERQPTAARVKPLVLGNDPWRSAESAIAISDTLIRRIKAVLRIEDLLATELEPTGSHHSVTLCPLHDDHNPSFWVDTAQQICGCYAGCTDKPLDVINLYARMNDLSNGDAIRVLARMV